MTASDRIGNLLWLMGNQVMEDRMEVEHYITR